MLKIKIDKADTMFSKAIRLRDKFRCSRCGKFYPEGVGLQVSHFYGRRYESVRYDQSNVDTICAGCHIHWHGNPAEYYEWKKEQLGDNKFEALKIRAHNYKKKDRKMAYLEAKKFYELMEEENGKV